MKMRKLTENARTKNNVINHQNIIKVMTRTINPEEESVGNEVCPNTECKKINPGTTGTENTRTEVNSTMDDVGQT